MVNRSQFNLCLTKHLTIYAMLYIIHCFLNGSGIKCFCCINSQAEQAQKQETKNLSHTLLQHPFLKMTNSRDKKTFLEVNVMRQGKPLYSILAANL